MRKHNLMPLNLQFFAEGDGGTAGTTGTDTKGGAPAGNEGNQNPPKAGESGAKTFTQEEVNSIGAKEKAQGKSSILKLFGCATEEEAKQKAAEYSQWKESQKTEEQKKAENDQLMKDSLAKSEKRAKDAEDKVTAMIAGVNSESIGDALAIALTKVSDEKSLESVLADMKKEAKYAGFFNKVQGAGTGSSADHNKGGNKPENLGKRLAEARVSSEPKKSSFFTN